MRQGGIERLRFKQAPGAKHEMGHGISSMVGRRCDGQPSWVSGISAFVNLASAVQDRVGHGPREAQHLERRLPSHRISGRRARVGDVDLLEAGGKELLPGDVRARSARARTVLRLRAVATTPNARSNTSIVNFERPDPSGYVR